MQLYEIMTRDVVTIPPDATVQEAAARMRDRDIGALPVCEGARLVGIVTDRDLALRVIAEGRPLTTPVRAVMTPHVLYCFEDQTVKEAAWLMEERKVRRLVILDRAERIVGIVSLDDLAARAGAEALAGEVLKEIAE
ncbi:MAG TPA: CBS domain-containing protein [Chloroflexota bacterium]|nr:CBS domain-containing protein [Chloroflexota bacterium]